MQDEHKLFIKRLKRIFQETEEGEHLLLDLCDKYGFFATSYVAGDSHASAYKEGRRSVIAEIVGLTHTDAGKLAEAYAQYKQRKLKGAL